MTIALSSEQFVSAQRGALDVAGATAKLALDNAEKLATLGISSLRSLLEQTIESTQNLAIIKTPGDAAAIHAHLGQAHFASALAYSRSLYDIASQSHAQLTQLFDQQRSAINGHIESSLDDIHHGGHSGVAVAAVKSALSAANSAFDNAHRAARQVAEITDAGVSAAANATSRAVAANPAASARKKAA
jgi:phasin family protein